jgi:hypothetical protein
VNDPPETAYREAHPPPRDAPWNPRALRAFSLAAGSVALVPGATIGGMLAFARLNAGGVAMTWTLLAASLATIGLVVASVRRAVRVLREVPSQPVPERGRWLAGIAVPLSVAGLLLGLLGFVLTWLSTVQFSTGPSLHGHGEISARPGHGPARYGRRSRSNTSTLTPAA